MTIVLTSSQGTQVVGNKESDDFFEEIEVNPSQSGTVTSHAVDTCRRNSNVLILDPDENASHRMTDLNKIRQYMPQAVYKQIECGQPLTLGVLRSNVANNAVIVQFCSNMFPETE